MAHTPERSKGRRGSGRFAGIPHAVMNHPDYVALSPYGVRLLLEMAKQYNGHNNGDLTAAWAVMRERGWRSETTLNRAVHELMNCGLLIRTREGRFINPGKQCALYAVAWQAIDQCAGKNLEIQPTATPPRSFTAEIIKMPTPETGATGPRIWSHGAKKHAES